MSRLARERAPKVTTSLPAFTMVPAGAIQPQYAGGSAPRLAPWNARAISHGGWLRPHLCPNSPLEPIRGGSTQLISTAPAKLNSPLPAITTVCLPGEFSTACSVFMDGAPDNRACFAESSHARRCEKALWLRAPCAANGLEPGPDRGYTGKRAVSVEHDPGHVSGALGRVQSPQRTSRELWKHGACRAACRECCRRTG